jgi:hypothetical protein
MAPDVAVSDVERMLQAMNYRVVLLQEYYVSQELGLCVGWVVHPIRFSDCIRSKQRWKTTVVLSGEIFTPEERLKALSEFGPVVTVGKASYLGTFTTE